MAVDCVKLPRAIYRCTVAPNVDVREAQRPAKARVRVCHPCVLRCRPRPTTFQVQSANDHRTVAVHSKLRVLPRINFPAEFARPDQLGQRVEVFAEPRGLVLDVMSVWR